MSVSVITPTRLLPDRLDMLVELNASLSSNNCDVEHVIVIDGKTPQIYLVILRSKQPSFQPQGPSGKRRRAI